MNEQILAYLEYLQTFNEINKPPMPKFDLLAYNDNEYALAVKEVMEDFENVDDEHITLKYLQGEEWI